MDEPRAPALQPDKDVPCPRFGALAIGTAKGERADGKCEHAPSLCEKSYSLSSNDQGIIGFTIAKKWPPVFGRIVPDSAAHAANARAGDRILKVNGKPVAEFAELDWGALDVAMRSRPLTLSLTRCGGLCDLHCDGQCSDCNEDTF